MDTYKKKYKEALERARVWKDKSGMPADKQGILDDIFPELAGSEDEKVRKALIEMVHDTPNSECEQNYNVRKEDCLTWLEKQGEQKSIEWDEYDEMYVSALIAIVRKEDATTPTLRDTLTGWLRCLKERFKKDKL